MQTYHPGRPQGGQNAKPAAPGVPGERQGCGLSRQGLELGPGQRGPVEITGPLDEITTWRGFIGRAEGIYSVRVKGIYSVRVKGIYSVRVEGIYSVGGGDLFNQGGGDLFSGGWSGFI